MSSAANSRRRPAQPNMTPSLIDSFQNMSLRKGDTFHPTSNTSIDDFWDPLESRAQSPLMPSRSTTCPKSLEDLLLGAGDRRTAELIARVDKAVATQSKLALSTILTEPEVLPVPIFLVHDTSIEERPVRKTRTHSHGSDSGIGTSISGSEFSATATASPTKESFTGISDATEQRGLSKYACQQIHKHIVKPILAEEKLQEFHPLIKDVPARIGKKEIKNLRDLEKTLIFLAPDYSRSPYKYLQFCERTIRVLHTTVTTLHESDQRALADRPYTQGYFFDLVEQIRRYAQILAVTREKQEKGEKLNEMDYSPDESVSLIGGVSHNGKPAELVRHKDGKTISIATDQVLSSEDVASGTMKRSMDDIDVDEDDVLRSMARRKKNAKPEIHECSLCDKEFKRPCDLTKHLKTHERPWKCPDDKCKYHDHGWPTEKERDRHVNDKHSAAPSLYRCLFPPCPYTSKRESNCKQHMEKAHGWDYIRSKNNGKAQLSMTRLPKGSVSQSPASVMLTPNTPILPSPSMGSYASASESSRHGSMPPPAAGPSNFGTPAFTHPSPDFSGHFNMNFDFNNMGDGFASSSTWPMTPAMSDDRRQSCDTMSSSGGLQLDGSAFDDGISPNDLGYNGFDFNDFTFPIQHQHQQITPNSNVAASISSHGGMQASPGAQLEQTFTYDAMNVDGDFDNGDFTLYDGGASTAGGASMFPSLHEGGSSWGNFNGHFDSQHVASLPTGNSTLDDLFPELKGH
ncbi:hypothetical protein LTR09_005609 [Extremus antarcticus]|uniref:C2H2-type domain-containing protein n=1 Tax=Extremus antarcticus TaxID=702011 RepID=A0AAJ0DN54_9PEZI|nr:hypothetical protein LTR09_005609 [Extremus antarcticus]